MVDAVSLELTLQFNISSLSKLADHLMYCMPQETYYGAWAYVGHWLSVYGSQIFCSYLSDQMHEIGHNLGLYHVSQGDDEYGDDSGYMASGYCEDNFPRMCFNGAQHWQLGWFSDKHKNIAALSLAGNDISRTRLIGAAEYTTNSKSWQKVVVRVQGGGDRYFIAFNRKVGNNNETQEGSDQVMI